MWTVDRGRSLAFLVLVLFVGCGRLTPASGVAAAPPASTVPAGQIIPTPTPTYQPGPNSTSGTVFSRSPTGVIIESVGEQQEVDLRSVLDVWKETSVPAAAIELGDQLDVNGTAGQVAFVARYVWVNIGRLDGVIRSIDATGMVIAYQRAGDVPRERRVELSPYLEIVQLGPGTMTGATRADLMVGRSVGMVLYRPHDGVPRATRIWLSPP